jgi:hypothetical protein
LLVNQQKSISTIVYKNCARAELRAFWMSGWYGFFVGTAAKIRITQSYTVKKRHSRKLLQVSLGICALAPIVTGLLGMAGIDNPVYFGSEKPSGVLLDSNLRFLNGLSVGIGIYTLLIIPEIRKRPAELRMICILIFFGAIGRLFSINNYGFPPFPYNLFPFVELALPPLFVLWQARVAS